MLIIVNVDYKFIWVDIGANGVTSYIIKIQELNWAVHANLLPIPPPHPLPPDNEPVP